MKRKIFSILFALVLVLSFSLVTGVPALAAPVVASVTETAFGTNTTNHNVTMPATVNAGDLLIVIFTNGGNATVTTPAGWTELASNTNGVEVRCSVYYKIAAGDEGDTTVNFVTSGAEQAAAQVYRITNWHGTDPPEISTAATNTSTAPDPASLNPAGWDVEDTLWLAVAGQDRGDQSGTTAYPASYTDGISTLSSNGTGSCRTHSARRVLAAASEDPGAFTIPTSQAWVAFTIAVRPVQYELTISSTAGGNVTTPGEGVFPCYDGEIVDLVAAPDADYQFVEWTGNVSTIGNVTAAATNITVNGDYSVTANFVAVYNLTMAADPGVGGLAIDLTDESPYAEGTEVSIGAVAAGGYQFVNWTAPAGVFGNANATITNFTMPAQNVTVTANFEVSVYPTVTTKAATNITTDSSTLNMDYTVGNYGNYTSVDVRFAYKKSPATEWSYTPWESKSVNGTYAKSLTSLTSDTRYEFKAQLEYNDTEIEGATRHFTTTTSPDSSPPGVQCFIATAAYGTSTAEQLDVLREFRDVVLLESTAGSQFVALYYQLSPPVAEFIAGNELLRSLVRELLVDPIVWMVEATRAIWRN